MFPEGCLNPFHIRLFPRFLLWLVVLAVLPVMIVGKIVVGINDDSLNSEVQRYHSKLAESFANQINERLETSFSSLNVGAGAVRDPNLSWLERSNILQVLLDANNNFAIISVLASSGQEVLKVYNPSLAPEVEKNPSLTSHKNSETFNEMKKAKAERGRLFREKDRLFVETYVPFRSPAGLNAMYVKLSLNDISDQIANEQIGATGFAFLADQNNNRLTPINSALKLNEESLADKSIMEAAFSGAGGTRIITDQNNQDWVIASQRLNILPAIVVTQQTRKEAFAESIRGRQLAFGIVFITSLLAIFVSFFLARSLTKPLLSITRVAHNVDISRGEFPEPVEVKTGDEIQDLAQTFNSMLSKLRQYSDMQVEKLIIEQKKTEAIIFSIEDGLIMTDYQGKIQLVNHRARGILNISTDINLLGEPLWKFLPSEELKTTVMELLTNPAENNLLEVKIPRGQKENYYKVSSEEVRTPTKNEALGIVTVLHDITLEHELDQMKEEFLHSITHDLRNPLTAIRGFIRLFQSGQTGDLNPIQTKMLDTMDKASLRLLTMVNDILDLARLESGRLQLHLDKVNVEEVAKRVLELFTPKASDSGIHLNINISGDDLDPLICDPNLLERIFTNLIGNAAKFTPDGGSITTNIQNGPEEIRFSVKDTGEGIPESYLDKVFDKFRQVEGHFKGGAGLGLTICKKIVEAHNGKIWVESKEGEGAEFIFTIPRNLHIPREEGGQKAA